jgi:hypothetical protein
VPPAGGRADDPKPLHGLDDAWDEPPLGAAVPELPPAALAPRKDTRVRADRDAEAGGGELASGRQHLRVGGAVG